MYSSEHTEVSEKGNSATWDVNSVTSNDFQSMITSAFSLKLSEKENT